MTYRSLGIAKVRSIAVSIIATAMCWGCSTLSPHEIALAEDRLLDKNNLTSDADYYRTIYEGYVVAVEGHSMAAGDGFDEYLCSELLINPYNPEIELPSPPGPKMIAMYERVKNLYNCRS